MNNALTGGIEAILAENGGDGDKPVDNTIRQAWNDYITYLDSKGLKGHPSLDKGGKGFQVLEQYRKEHPETPITKELIPTIQKEFGNYRQFALDEIKNKKANFAPGTDENNFLRALSIVDGIPGQRTTSFAFPNRYLQTFNDKKLEKTTNLGFAPTVPAPIQ